LTPRTTGERMMLLENWTALVESPSRI